MLMLSDCPRSGLREFGEAWQDARFSELPPSLRHLWTALAPNPERCRVCDRPPKVFSALPYEALVIIDRAEGSQFDALKGVALQVPNGTPPVACIALEGSGFHGNRGRSWQAMRGNLHLSVLMPANTPASAVGAGFSMLPSVAALECIESTIYSEQVPRGESDARPASEVGIKWVNDVLINGGKVAGVITDTICSGQHIEQVIFGIGVNLSATPEIAASIAGIAPTSMAEHLATPVMLRDFLPGILERIDVHYAGLMEEGPDPLWRIYRDRSLVLGRQVAVRDDSIPGAPGRSRPVTGRVSDIDPDLSLRIEGQPEPVRRGRLSFLAEND